MSWRSGTVAVLAVAGCLLAGQPAGAATPAATAPPVSWGACAPDVLQLVPPADREKYSCAVYNVPLDYARPSAGTIGLAMLRRAADDQAHKIGSLFLNPGGPGGPGYTLPIPIASLLPAEVAQRFDLIGFDPRGVGQSAPLRCFTSQEAADAVFSRIVDVPVTQAEIDSTLHANRDYTDACAANAGPLLPHMSTLDVARDLDRMRQFNKAMAAELGNARLVSNDAFGHTILGGASVCADTIATRYLVDLKVPARGTVCQPDKQPFE
jgi:hypothetical protein